MLVYLITCNPDNFSGALVFFQKYTIYVIAVLFSHNIVRAIFISQKFTYRAVKKSVKIGLRVVSTNHIKPCKARFITNSSSCNDTELSKLLSLASLLS